jgi:hypothetical protein
VGDLEVATDNLWELGSQLNQLGDQLKTGDANVSYTADQLAHSLVIGAMNEFTSNWDDNRKHLAGKLVTLGDHARNTAEGFEQADLELARKINEIMGH